MIGEATRLAPFLEGGAKQYQGVISLGTETDTLDRDGAVVRTAAIPRSIARGSTRSPLASRARSTRCRRYSPRSSATACGFTISPGAAAKSLLRRPAGSNRTLALQAEGGGSIRFSVECSTGTYIRSLARDIGAALGSAAHLAELRRIRSGPFSIEGAHALDEALALLRDARGAGALIPMRDALADLPEVEIDSVLERRIRNGDSSALDGISPAGATLFKVLYQGRLLAIASADSAPGARLIRVFGGET